MSENSSKEAAKAEVEEVERVTFKYDGQEYTVERDCLDDAVVIEAIERDHFASVVSRLLGPAQWRVFNLTRRRATDLIEMANAIFAATADTTVGESKG